MSERTASLRPDRALSPLLAAGMFVPFVIAGCAAWWLQAHWDMIPDRFPVHWNIHGQANRWSHKTFRGVYGPLIFAALMALMLDAIAFCIVRNAARVGTDGFRRATTRFMVQAASVLSLLLSAVGLKQALTLHLPLIALSAFSLVSIGLLLIPLLRAKDGSSAEVTPEWAWKVGGLIYYNPGDPALMVQKHDGVGYTMNFAHSASWVLLVVITMAFPIAISWLLRG